MGTELKKIPHAEVQKVNDIVRELKASGAIMIREYHPHGDELAVQIQGALDNGKSAVFIPTRYSMRHFFNAQGFAYFMREVLEQLNDYSVLIEPNFYGSRLILAVAPLEKQG